MNVVELTVDEVIGFNRKVIADTRARNPKCQERHNLIRRSDLESAVRGVFFQSVGGYVNLPVEKMAGLLLYKIAQRQAFENGNKRTAVLSCYFFLYNHGVKLRIKKDEVMSLLWDIASGTSSSTPKATEDDAIKYVFDNVMPRC